MLDPMPVLATDRSERGNLTGRACPLEMGCARNGKMGLFGKALNVRLPGADARTTPRGARLLSTG